MRRASKAKQYVNRTLLVALVIVVVGLLGFTAHILIAKITACPPGGNAVWYCNIKGKSYIIVILLASLGLSIAGFMAYAIQKKR